MLNLGMQGSGYPNSTWNGEDNRAVVTTNGTNGLAIGTTNGPNPILFGVNNTEIARFGGTGGLMLGSPTGGDKGTGKLNVAGDVYKNNTAYTNPDYVLEHWATGRIERFADKPGASTYGGMMALEDVEGYAREHLHLPRFGQDAGHGLFSGSDALLASLEEAYLHIFALNHRVRQLEERLARTGEMRAASNTRETSP